MKFWKFVKNMSANVKANIKQQEIKDLVTVSYIFFKKYPQNMKYNVKEGVFFIWLLLAFVHPSWYFQLTTGVGGVGGVFLLNRKNLLIVTKVICQQSIIYIYIYGFMWIFSYLFYLLLVDEDLEKVGLFNLYLCAGRCGL